MIVGIFFSCIQLYQNTEITHLQNIKCRLEFGAGNGMLKNLPQVHQGTGTVFLAILLGFLLHKLLLASVSHPQNRGNDIITSCELAMAESHQRACPSSDSPSFKESMSGIWRMASGTIKRAFYQLIMPCSCLSNQGPKN